MIEREASFSDFSDIAPLSGDEATQALTRLRESRDWVRDLSRMIPLKEAQRIRENWEGVSSVEGFQSEVVKTFLDSLMAATTDGVTWNAADGALDDGLLYLTNHRDIVLDPSLVNVALLDHGRGSTEIGIGSNLLGSAWVNDLVRLNRCFVVERSGSARDRYMHSLRTAAYIRSATSSGTPVWLAHREGRAKDGHDATAPALIRTLSEGCNPNVWNELQVVPVSISYEWDPCDAFKVNELLHRDTSGAYSKLSGEDELSMWTGLVGAKGRVHLEFSSIMSWEHSAEESRPERGMALAYDKRLMSGMRLWPNQRIAAEELGLANSVCDLIPEATPEEREDWVHRKSMVEDALKERGWSREQAVVKWCQGLAAPLQLRHSLLDEARYGDSSGD
ncbi:MAG: hypothetical protein ACPG66_07380 [Flavobacteriales bacterium]